MPRDVRMRGFERRHDVDEVLRLLDARLAPLPAEEVPVDRAAGRVLARGVVSAVDVPGFDRSAMDGYALRGEETFGATTYAPRTFSLRGEARPGHPFDGAVGPGEAVRVMTGAPIPTGADAVCRAEVAREEDDGATVLILEPVSPRKNVGARGEDVRAGTALLDAGRRLRPQDAGLCASVGEGRPSVVRRPRVAVLVTGDELLPPGEAPSGARIVDSNSLVLAALARRDGAADVEVERLRDDRSLVRARLAAAAARADVVLVSGGSSVGTEDHAPTLVAELGELPVHGVAMRPSSPAGVGFVDGRPVFLVPGNPVSCLCAYEFFAGPAIRRLGGRPMDWPHRRVTLPARRKLVSQVGRVDYVRVRIVDGAVEPLAVAGASILSSTVRADGAVVIERDSEGIEEGGEVEVRLY